MKAARLCSGQWRKTDLAIRYTLHTMLDESDRPVRVAAGIIKNNDQYLVCQRGINRRYGMKWEFPGGKTYPDESLAECLIREFFEELRIEPTEYKELATIHASYSDGGNFLITYFLVTEFSGELQNKVFEKIEWVTFAQLSSYDLLEGSKPALRYLQ